MPPLIALFLRNAVIGFALAAVFVAGLVVFDVAGLGALLTKSLAGLFGMGVLTFFLGLTFGSVQIGIAVMALGNQDHPGSGHRLWFRRQPQPEAEAIPLRVRAR